MTIKNTTDSYGNKLTEIDMIPDGERAHHAIPHQNIAESSPAYITAKEAAELAGESVPWVHSMANKGNIETIGRKGKCVFKVFDVEKIIMEKEQQRSE